jgi:hypothetical protein
MNQDQVKQKLLSIEDAPLEFSLIFSGKRSKKVNGLYKPDSREIIIHNRNFDSGTASGTSLLLYTAIHEYAHHLQSCAHGGKLPGRAHTSEFWAIFHGLLEKAEKKGIYTDVFSDSAELTALTEKIRNNCLAGNGNLVKELGKQLLRASEICREIGARFEDYIDRVLRIPRQAATVAIKIFEYDLKPETGVDNMRFLAGIRNDEDRAAAEEALIKGKSPDMVKTALKARPAKTIDPKESLEKEKLRLERTIASLSRRLEEVKTELGEG